MLQKAHEFIFPASHRAGAVVRKFQLTRCLAILDIDDPSASDCNLDIMCDQDDCLPISVQFIQQVHNND